MVINKDIIDSSDPGVVATEMPIRLSDEKLKAILSSTYERALKDNNQFKLYKHYGVFLSIAGTLFLSLLTSSFRNIGPIDASIILYVAIAVCIATAGLGFVLMAVAVSKKTKSDMDSRDKAIQEMLNSIIQSE